MGWVADARGRVRPGHFPGGSGGWPGIGILRFGGLLVADEMYFSLNIEAVADASTPVLRSTSP